VKGNPYETDRYLNEYLLFHYGRAEDLCPFSFVQRDWLRFHERLREEYLLPIPPGTHSLGLDVGCAVGRFTFELGRVLHYVIGVDNSVSFIRAARCMATQQNLTATVHESGKKFTTRKLVPPKASLRSRVEFQLGDALDLSKFAKPRFAVVSAINLIDRLPRPREFLQQLPQLVAPGGQLLLATPFTWLEQFTPAKQWLTSQQLQSFLRPHFRLARQGELPFLIREHRRKYQLLIAEVFTFLRHA
jgi:SAM-dependent methyltransferase